MRFLGGPRIGMHRERDLVFERRPTMLFST
jgi:hypothetical protein